MFIQYKDSWGLFVVHELEQKGCDCLNDCEIQP